MDNLDLVVLRTLRDWRVQGKPALLATVVRTWGSSPRPVGSIMALCQDGSVVGSVSGGCIEDDLIHRFSQAYAGAESARMPSGAPQLLKYGIQADEAHRFGLPCGGTLQLLLEFDPDAAVLADLVARLEAGQLVRRITRLADGKVSLQGADTPDEQQVSPTQLSNVFGPEYRMLLIGAGQLAEYLATMALFSGFSVVVCDPRAEYHRSWSVPGAQLVTDMPDDTVQAFKPDLRSCIITLTHDPKLDDLALIDALASPAFYIGAIGSRLNNSLRRERLMEYFDLTAEDLSRLRAPVGMYIGSKTPAEIAVSIMAEVLAVKNGVPLSVGHDVAAAKDTLGIPREGDSVVCAL